MAASAARRGLALLIAGLVGASPAAASALDNDPVLSRYFTLDANGKPIPDEASFGELARELGMAMAPKLLAPAETMGLNGFQVGLELSTTNIDEAAGYWQRGIEDESPPGALLTSQFHLRKGLPFSFEVGGAVTYLVNSELWAVGGEVKWAPNEAIEAFPVDVAVHAALNRVLGSTELDMTVLGFDFVLSRGFGAAGVANVAPYMAYNPVFVFARSRVLDVTPANPDDPEQSIVLAEQNPVLHRFVIGTRFVFSVVSFTPEIVLTKGLQTYNFNLGANF